MCKTKCCLAILALCINFANSWDIAITTGDQLEFYSSSNKTGNEGVRFRDLTALAYDAVHNMLLFVDKQNDNASIFSYHLANKKYQPLVRRRSYENIQGIAFDPVESLLFWTDTNERSIYWISLKPGSKNDVYGNLLIKMDNEIPRAIAVDSCRGYIYWTNTNITKPTIERARFDGSDRRTVIGDNIFMPVSIAVDQQTKKLYWADDKEGIHYSIESSDLDGTQASRKTLHVGTFHQPNALTVSKDSVYWVDWGYKSVWKLPKKALQNAEPKELIGFSNKVPFGIVANYQVADQTEGVNDCSNLVSLSQNTSAINNSFTIPKDVGLFCLHGVKVDGKLACTCSQGYIGERCEISVCQNFCFQGDCSLEANGQPTCRCQKGFNGARCETNMCDGHCLNNGVCSIDDSHKAVCACVGDYTGKRCETYNPVVDTTTHVVSVVTEPCNCTKPKTATKFASVETSELLSASDDFVDTPCNDGWDPVRDPILMVLGILCGLMCLVCAVLITKILHLKKRPRCQLWNRSSSSNFRIFNGYDNLEAQTNS
ncbi:low-density lipoprotein receptor repeat domain-containing protein cueball isoform X3 [Choristoneura fumiferana]